jgi:trehalose 6-phosphate synthase
MGDNSNHNRLVAVSNRLPIVLKQEDGAWQVKPGSGGLVTAMSPVLKNRGGLWIGWPGTDDSPGLSEALDRASGESGFDLEPVMLSADEIQGYYYGFANEILWPLFHGFETRCNFDPDYWRDYRTVNRKFADVVGSSIRENDFVWIHDYHLMLVASELREHGVEHQLGYFLHIPFPSPDLFFKLPWRAQIMRGLLDFDLVGFQTMRDRRNFLACLEQLNIPDLEIVGEGAVVNVTAGGHQTRIGAFPISIDFEHMSNAAASQATADRAWELHEQFPERQLIIGMDRLDYSKGIPERLHAFRHALATYPELRGNVTFVQVTVPSREQVPEYERLRQLIEQLVSEINGEYTEPGWVPVHYLHRSLGREEVYAYLRASEIALVTPLRDGMNLVAKEFAACHSDKRGVLVLSEFAGAAAEMQDAALLVNPYDIEGMAEAIHAAYTMPEDERQRRMEIAQDAVRGNDIFNWVDSILEAAFAKHLSDFQLQEFVPDLGLEEQESTGQ